MSLHLHVPPSAELLKPTITVFGVGGAGGNAVNNMISSQLQGVNFVVANTDAQSLERSTCEHRIQLGTNLTRGLGAGASPDVGREAAEEVIDEIAECVDGSNMVFITAGMGGGTGTGSAPVIARLAREQGILTVGVVTKPFMFEGTHRMRLAEQGLEELQKYVDTLIVIPNQNLFRIANERTTFADAFRMADEVLHSGVRGVTDLMVMPGLINLDFADIRAVMREMGKAMMGTGEASGENRSIEAAEAAISNPLLDDVSMKGAKGVLINITGGPDMTLFEVDEAANRIRDEVDPDANIIFGSTFNENIEGTVRVSVVATGIDMSERTENIPTFRGNSNVKPMLASGGANQRNEPQTMSANRFGPVSAVPASPQPQVQQPPKENAVPRFTRSQSGNSPASAAVAAVARETQEPALQAAPQPVSQVENYSSPPEARILQEDDGGAPAFMPPRAVQAPASARPTHAPKHEEEEKGARSFNFFQRIGRGRRDETDEGSDEPVSRVTVTEARKPELFTNNQKEEEYQDIPAFLRRQAN